MQFTYYGLDPRLVGLSGPKPAAVSPADVPACL